MTVVPDNLAEPVSQARLQSAPKLMRSRELLRLPVIRISSPSSPEYLPRVPSRANSTTPLPWKLDTRPLSPVLHIAGRSIRNVLKPLNGEPVFGRAPQSGKPIQEEVGVKYSWEHVPASFGSPGPGGARSPSRPVRLAPFSESYESPESAIFQDVRHYAGRSAHSLLSPEHRSGSSGSYRQPRDLGLSFWPRLPPTPTVSTVGQSFDRDPFSRKPIPEAASSSPFQLLDGMQLAVVDRQAISSEGQPVYDAYHRRRQYGEALEKNWFRQLRDFRRQQRQKRKLDGHIKKHMAFYLRDFDRAFFLTDNDDDAKAGSTTGSANSDGTNLETRQTAETEQNGESSSCSPESNHVHENEDFAEGPASPYIHFASMDANVSDCETEHSDIDIQLKDGTPYDTSLRHKGRQLRHRREQRFRFLHEGISDSEDDDDDLVKLSDAELRAMRLQLKKNEDNDDFQITQTPEEIMAEINKLIARSKKMADAKRKKRRRKKMRPSSADERNAKAERARAIKSRFLSEYGFLLSNRQRNMASNSPGVPRPPQESEMAKFLREMEEAKRLRQNKFLQTLGSLDRGSGEAVSGDGGNAAQDGVGDLPHMRIVASARGLHRRRTHAGIVAFPHRYRRLDKGTVQQNKTIEPLTQIGCGLNAPDSSRKHESKTVVKDQVCGNIMKAFVVQPKRGYAPEPADVGREFRSRKRTMSARHVGRYEPEIGLRELLDGVDFPAKEIKVQIAERRLRKQRQKRLLAEEQARLRAGLIHNTNDNTDDEAEDKAEDEPSTPVKVFPKYLTRPSMADIFKPLLWEPRYLRPLSSRTKDMLDTKVIPYLSDMFLEMRHCRYIRWNLRDQAIISRLIELELFHLGSFEDGFS